MNCRNRKLVAGSLALCALLLGPLGASAENLFSEAQFQSFVADKRAYQVGDTLVLLIVENSVARQQSDRSVDRQYDVSAGYQGNGSPEMGTLELGVDRNAADSTGRTGALQATMTVTVQSLDAVGNLAVAGQQRIVVNGKEQLITVEGLVRPIDVAANNSVLSSRLANARIEYDGYDVNGDGEKRNWLYRTLSKIGLI